MCEDCILLHTEARWLPKWKVLARANKLHERICKYLNDELWMSEVEYLTKIFKHLNSQNNNMQGRNKNILASIDELVAFTKTFCIEEQS